MIGRVRRIRLVVVYQIALLHHKDDIVRIGVVLNPLGLSNEIGVVARIVRIELGIGKNGQDPRRLRIERIGGGPHLGGCR